jgi:maltose alpha-D-glucosyltransferase/alpha-amylase
LEQVRDIIYYEIFVQGFTDSNGDGIGDLQGVIEKVDYINDLGFNAVWLGPIWDSPWDDAGYDVRDYYMVAPRYGTLGDLRRLAGELHVRGMKLVLDLVPEHNYIKGFAERDGNFMTNFFYCQPALNYGFHG